MKRTRLIAVAIVIAVCVSAVAYLVIANNASGKYVSKDDTGRLTVLGNANNDDYLNNDDIEELEKIIKGEKENTKYADANNDGVVDESDVIFVKNIIDRKTDYVFVSQIYNKQEMIQKSKYPLSAVCVAGPETLNVMKGIGATAKIVCLSGIQGATFDARFYSDVYNLPKVGPDQWNVDLELISDYTVDAIISMDASSWIPNYDLLEKAGIPTVRIEAANGANSLRGIVTLGFLMDSVEKANELVGFFDGILKDIKDKTSSLSDSERVTALFVTMSNYVEGPVSASEYSGTLELAGAKAVADVDGWGTAARRQFQLGDEWLLAPQYQADFIVHSKALGLGSVDKEGQWANGTKYFLGMDAVKNGNYFQLNSVLSPVLRIAFMANMFYPEVFGENYAVDLVQEYYDQFIPNVTDFDASTDVTWTITANGVS